MAFVRAALSRPGADRAVVVIATLLLAFSLDTGLSADDYVHKLMVNGSHAFEGFVRAPLDIYRFTNPDHTPELMREGVLSWWEDPEAELAFFRPLSALTHYVDYTFWPDQPLLIRIHSLLWSVFLFASVLVLYRELVSPAWVCALAVFLYAMDDGRGWLVSWIAARNAVVATAISVWALIYYHRARARGGKLAAWLSPLALLAALLASEGALSICAYLFAYALCLDRGPLAQRLLRLAPHAAVALAWRATYVWLGYGVAHSGLYFDPIGDAGQFALHLLDRAPVLLGSQLGGLWSDIYSVAYSFPALQRGMVLGGAALVLIVGYALWPLRGEPIVRFGALGALLSVLPASCTFTADRMLTWVALGACLLLARLLATYVDARASLTTTPLRAWLLPALVLFLVFMKGVFDPSFLASRARGNLIVRDMIDRAAEAVPTDPSIRDKRVVYVNPPAVPLAAYIALERAALDVPRPENQIWLATGETELAIERLDDRTLLLRQRGGFLLSPGSHLFRSPSRPFERGAVVELDGTQITVKELTEDQRPSLIQVRFDRPLDDPSLYWLRWDDTGYTRFTPPPVGERVHVAAVDLSRALLGNMLRLPFDGRLPPPDDPQWDRVPAIGKQ